VIAESSRRTASARTLNKDFKFGAYVSYLRSVLRWIYVIDHRCRIALYFLCR
jgi:hypothetical protein